MTVRILPVTIILPEYLCEYYLEDRGAILNENLSKLVLEDLEEFHRRRNARQKYNPVA